LSVNVSDTLTLDAGWWEETMEETALGKPLPCRLIHPPEPTMYDQVLRHLEMISRETRIPPKSQLDFGEVALATIAVCLRWGTYFAVLADRAKPIWPQTEQKRADIMPNPARWLANGLINAYWRNKSGIEDIHAGEWEARPLLQRRITPMQEYTIVQKVAEGIVPSMHAIYNVVNKKSEDGWEERALSLAINFSPPDYWSLTKRTTEVLLEGAEP
jgi:hypothetical protein